MQIFTGAGEVVDAAANWSLGFLAIEAARADTIAFTAPYVTIEGTCAVRRGGPIDGVAAIDRPDVTVLVATGAAYDHVLSRELKHATIVRATTPGDSFEQFAQGQGDAVAGVRQSLDRRFGTEPDFVVLDEAVLRIDQAVAVPRRLDATLPFLEAFIAQAKADGFVRAALDASGQAGLKVPQ